MLDNRLLRDLVARAVEGDDTALTEFVRLTQPAVWKLCHALGSTGEIEDLVQETYLQAIRSLPRFRGDAPVMAWLLRIGRNVCANHVRRRKRDRNLVERIAPTVTESTVMEPSFAASLLDGLPRPQVEAFVLTQLMDLSYEEAAAVLDCPVGTVRSRLSRARSELIRRADDAANSA